MNGHNMKASFIVLLAAAFLCSCASTPFVGDLSPQAARRHARRDFAAGKPKIYMAGGRGAYEPGISDSQKRLVARFPRDSSLAGCTNPRVGYSRTFATAYNQEIVSLLENNR